MCSLVCYTVIIVGVSLLNTNVVRGSSDLAGSASEHHVDQEQRVDQEQHVGQEQQVDQEQQAGQEQHEDQEQLADPEQKLGRKFSFRVIEPANQKELINSVLKWNPSNILTTVRKPFDKRISLMKNYWNIYKEINKKNNSKEEKLSLILVRVIRELQKILPRKGKVDDLEINGKMNYVCGAQGEITDLRSVQYTGSDILPDKSGGQAFRIRGSFQNLQVVFNRFYLSASVTDTTGRLTILFGENEVEATVTVPTTNVARLFWRFLKKDCIVRIEELKMLSLKFEKATFEASASLLRDLAEKNINAQVIKKEEEIKQKFELKVLRLIHNTLPVSGSRVCKSPELNEYLKNRGVSFDNPNAQQSSQLKKYCL